MGQKRIAWDTEGQRDLVKNGLLGTHRWSGVKTDVFGGQWGACRSVGWADFSVVGRLSEGPPRGLKTDEQKFRSLRVPDISV